MMDAIVPERSHTFRSGGVEKWRQRLSPANRKRIEALAGDLIDQLGYEI